VSRGAFGLPRWFEEGLATLSAGQVGVDGYFDRARVIEGWQSGRAVPPSQYDSRGRDSDQVTALPKDERFHFLYSQYALLIDDLISRQGRPRFQRLLGRLIDHEPMRNAFRAEYGTDPDSYFADVVARETKQPRRFLSSFS
jgi:hypothetical protein